MALTACEEDKEFDHIENNDGCPGEGLEQAFYAGRKQINWDAMKASSTLFDQTAKKILGYAMIGDAKFKRLTFDQENSFYNSEKPEGSAFYNHVITSVINGKSPGQTEAIKKLIGECGGLIVHIYTVNCQERVFGIDWSDKGLRFKPLSDGLKLGKHLDTHGKLGEGNKARDEFDLVGKGMYPPLWAGIPQADFEANYVG